MSLMGWPVDNNGRQVRWNSALQASIVPDLTKYDMTYRMKSTADCWIVRFCINLSEFQLSRFRETHVKIIHNFKHTLPDDCAFNIYSPSKYGEMNLLRFICEMIGADQSKTSLKMCLADSEVDYEPSYDLTKLQEYNYEDASNNTEMSLRHMVLTFHDPAEQRITFDSVYMGHVKPAKRDT